MERDADGLVLLFCGGYRSGATLAYRLTGEYAERVHAGRRIGFVPPERVAALEDRRSLPEPRAVAVARCHLGPAEAGGGAGWRRLRERGRLLPVYTVRDWREVVHSWSRLFGQELDEVFADPRWRRNLASLESWLEEGARVQRHETLLADPLATLRELAALAELPMDGDAMVAAVRSGGGAGRHGRGAGVRGRGSARFGDDRRPEARTLLHAGHLGGRARDGWRAWTPAQRALVAAHVTPLMVRFGYEWGEDW